MLRLDVDQTALAATIVANILTALSIHIQSYLKRRIVDLAFHDVTSMSLKRLWLPGVTLLVIAECSYFVAVGFTRPDFQVLPLGVFAAISNVVLPPLLYENHKHTVYGTLLSQWGVLVLVLSGYLSDEDVITFQTFKWNDKNTQLTICGELVVGLILIFIKESKPTNCSLTLGANAGLSALMGSHVVTAIKIIMAVPDNSKWQSLMTIVVLVCFILQFLLVSKSLENFSTLQVVPHHFVIFFLVTFLNSVLIFKEYKGVSSGVILVRLIGHILMILGVWTAAAPHWDLPVDIGDMTLLPELKHRVHVRWGELQQRMAEESVSTPSSCSNIDWLYSSLVEEYCKAKRELRDIEQSPFSV